MEDSIHHKQLRSEMVQEIRRKGTFNREILDAMSRVPRHLFLDPERSPNEAYADRAMEIGEGQTISQPYTVAYQTQLLDIKPGDKVLEIGTGSGYQAAVLFELGAKVYSVERQKKLYSAAKKNLSRMGYSGIHVFFKDGSLGLPEEAPFDKILVTAGAAQMPNILLDELKPGGVMVIPVGVRVQKMLKVTKTPDSGIVVQEYEDFQFVKFLAGTVGNTDAP
jgi:protein-L-isoaspartate(D-aspartate) O-methyltransferase